MPTDAVCAPLVLDEQPVGGVVKTCLSVVHAAFRLHLPTTHAPRALRLVVAAGDIGEPMFEQSVTPPRLDRANPVLPSPAGVGGSSVLR